MGLTKYHGGSSLAKELGIAPRTVTVKRQKGLTDDQIRQQARLRAETVAAGGKVRGRVTGTRLDVGLLRQRVGKIVRKEDGKADIAAPPPAPPPTVGRTYVPSRKRHLVQPTGQPPVRQSVQPPAPSVSVIVPVKEVPTEQDLPNVFDDDPASSDAFIRDPVTGENILQAQLRKEVALANDRELTVLQKRKELVPIGQVNNHFSTVIITCRDMMMRLGPDNRDRLAAETDPIKIERMIDKEVRKILSVLRKMEGDEEEDEETVA